MKKTYVVQLIIDLLMIAFGICLFALPKSTTFNPNSLFYMTMSVYAALELFEYVFDRTRLEPLFIFFSSAAAAFSGFFLKYYVPNYVLSITIAVWVVLIVIIKIISLKEINVKKSNLFIIKLAAMSIIAMIGILVSINIYYRISSILYMLALLYLCYGLFEITCDFLTFLSEKPAFIKE